MRKVIYLFVSVLAITLACVLVVNHIKAVAFDPNNLIDDGVFNNSTSMSASQINGWLNNFPNSCISPNANGNGNTGFRTPDPQGWSASQNRYLFGGSVTAGEAIYDTSQLYHVNPQVILATLQKEQSIVSGSAGCHYNSPDPATATNSPCGSARTPCTVACIYAGGCMNIALGYGCPNYCAAVDEGFSMQLTLGTWLLRFAQERAYGILTGYVGYEQGDENFTYVGPMTVGVRKRSASSSAISYDGLYTTQNGVTVSIANGSTAALYNFTPFTSGNQNFDSIFQSWFGSLSYPEPLGGILYYQASTGKIFLITTDNNTRYYVPTWSMIVNYRLDRYQVITTDDATINQYTDGGTLSSLVWDSGGVYLVNNGIKYHAPSAQTCTDWGLACLDNTVTKQLGSAFQNSYLSMGTDLGNLASYGSTYYKMQTGQRLPIANQTTLFALGYAPSQALALTDANVVQPLGSLLMTTPGVLKFSPSQIVYYFDGNAYYSVTDGTIYNDWNLSKALQINPPQSSYNTTPPASSVLSPWYQDAGGEKYIIDQGKIVHIPSSMLSAWQTVTFATQPQALASSLPQVALQNYVSTSGGIFQIYNGKSHHVPNYASYLALGITNNQTTILGADKLTPVPQGSDALGDGVIITIQGDPKLYVINNGKTTYIPDPNTFSAFGFSWTGFLSYPSTILNDYPLAPSPLASSVAGGNYYVVGSGAMYWLAPNLASDYGIVGSKFQAASTQTVKNSPAGVLSRFMYNKDTGRIYYASGGAIHYVTTYSAFVAYGGTHTSISVLNNADMALFIEAQPVQ